MLNHIIFTLNPLRLCTCGRAMLVVFLMAIATGCEGSEIPHLRKQGTATQLIVDGEPFLMLGGELGIGNSSSSSPCCSTVAAGSLEYMNPIWPPVPRDPGSRAIESERFVADSHYPIPIPYNLNPIP
jgi:hypothetical protein